MNEITSSDKQRNYTKPLIIFGFTFTLGWQALILLAAPRFIRIWDALGQGSTQHFPALFRFFFGNALVRWLIFAVSLALLIYFVRQKPIQTFAASITLALLLAITLIMQVNIYMPSTTLGN